VPPSQNSPKYATFNVYFCNLECLKLANGKVVVKKFPGEKPRTPTPKGGQGRGRITQGIEEEGEEGREEKEKRE
jgi:hypothetical protein